MAFLKTLLGNSLLFLFYRPSQARQLFQSARNGSLKRDTNACLVEQVGSSPAGKAVVVLDDCCPGKFWIIGVDDQGALIDRKFDVVNSGLVNIYLPPGASASGAGDWTFNNVAITYGLVHLARELHVELLSNLCWKFVQNKASAANASGRQLFLPGLDLRQVYANSPLRGDDSKNNYAQYETPPNRQTYGKALARATAAKARVFLDRLQREQKELGKLRHTPAFIGRDLAQPVNESAVQNLLETFDQTLMVSDRRDTGQSVRKTQPQAKPGFVAKTPVQADRADHLFGKTVEMLRVMSGEQFRAYQTQAQGLLQRYQNTDFLNSVMQRVFKRSPDETVQAICPNGLKPAIVLNRFSVNPTVLVAAVPAQPKKGIKCEWYTFVGDAWFMQAVLKQFNEAHIPLAVAREEALTEAWQTALPDSGDRNYFRDILYTRFWSTFYGINMGSL
jgi:hypothetical protein